MADEDIETRILRKVAVWIVAGGVAVGGVSGSGVLRVGVFTASDGRTLEKEIKEYCDEKIDREIEYCKFSILKNMPPQTTRRNNDK